MIVAFTFSASLIFALITFIPGGIGITEISQVAILSSLFPIFQRELLSSIILLDRILTYYLLIFVGAIILIIYRKRNKPKDIRWAQEDKAYFLYQDDKKLSLKEWNMQMNKKHSMHLLEEHPNILVKLEEKHRRNIILKLIGNHKGKIIADVGCEEGYITKQIIDKAKKVYCVDIDAQILGKAKKNINSKKASFIESDAQNINLPDSSVDIAVSTHVLEHLPDPAKGAKELFRIVKPEGKVVINVPNETFVLLIKKILVSLGLRFLIKNLNTGLAPGHLHVFTKRMLKKITRDKFNIILFRYNFPFFTNLFVVLKPIKRFK
jgi:ubiquinone/menaquinone biosynthesis C-methylase UbiE/cbb3-type cytochrome oxidase subunit 3